MRNIELFCPIFGEGGRWPVEYQIEWRSGRFKVLLLQILTQWVDLKYFANILVELCLYKDGLVYSQSHSLEISPCFDLWWRRPPRCLRKLQSVLSVIYQWCGRGGHPQKVWSRWCPSAAGSERDKLVKLVITRYINRDRSCTGTKFPSDWLYLESYGQGGSTRTFRLGDTELGQNQLKLLGENQSYWKGSLLIFYRRLNVKKSWSGSPTGLYGSMLTCYFIFIPWPGLAWPGLQSLPTTEIAPQL